MKKALIEKQIPEEAIYLDYAGFRTFDSVIRCKEIFGQASFIVISQQFHNERAVYIAHNKGIDAIAFNACDVDFNTGLKTQLREYLARVRLMIDLHLIHAKPKFLGKKIELK
jgi:SanA protein